MRLLNSGFTELSAEELNDKGALIHTQLTGNTYYPTTNPTLAALATQIGLFQTALNVTDQRQAYAVAADGQRFLLNTPVESASTPMTVVLNWPALLIRR